MDTAITNEAMVATPRDPHELLHIFESAEDLPTLPEVAIRLQKAVNDPKSNAKDIARIIGDDPAIATKVLRVVNSAFYAPNTRVQITELQPAIARLGFLAVSNIALSTSVFGAFAVGKKPAFNRREFWRHSVCVGIAASVLYDNSGDIITQRIRRDTVHLAGIVHDVGKILFERYANLEFYQAIQNARQEDIPVIKEEARYIGMGHDEAGAWLGAKWNLGQDIQAVLRWHHDPLGCTDPQYQWLVKLVHMADYICHNQGLGDSGNPSPSYDSRIREELKLTPDRIAELMDEVQEESDQSEILLSLDS